MGDILWAITLWFAEDWWRPLAAVGCMVVLGFAWGYRKRRGE